MCLSFEQEKKRDKRKQDVRMIIFPGTINTTWDLQTFTVDAKLVLFDLLV
jgi:hypothetical protein